MSCTMLRTLPQDGLQKWHALARPPTSVSDTRYSEYCLFRDVGKVPLPKMFLPSSRTVITAAIHHFIHL